MSTDTKAQVATPAQMVEAWECGVMHGRPAYAKEEVAAHPVGDIPDPTYHRDDVGWHSASTITNPGAIYAMRGYLKRQGLVAPEATEATWEERLRREGELRTVEGWVQEILRDVDKELADAAPTRVDFAQTLIQRLNMKIEEARTDA